MKDGCKLCYSKTEIKERGLCNDCSIFSDEQVLKNEMLDEIETIGKNVDYKKEAFLQKFGWSRSCEFPGSYWLWVKVIRGVTVATTMSSALDIEKNIGHYKAAAGVLNENRTD